MGMYAVCPFCRRELNKSFDRSIHCEDVVRAFDNNAVRDEHFKTYCTSNEYLECPYAKAIEDSYSEGGAVSVYRQRYRAAVAELKWTKQRLHSVENRLKAESYRAGSQKKLRLKTEAEALITAKQKETLERTISYLVAKYKVNEVDMAEVINHEASPLIMIQEAGKVFARPQK